MNMWSPAGGAISIGGGEIIEPLGGGAVLEEVGTDRRGFKVL